MLVRPRRNRKSASVRALVRENKVTGDDLIMPLFLVEGKNAIVYKKGYDWVIEYYSGSTLEQEALNVKF